MADLPTAVQAFYIQAWNVLGFQLSHIFVNICHFHLVLMEAILMHMEWHFIEVSTLYLFKD